MKRVMFLFVAVLAFGFCASAGAQMITPQNDYVVTLDATGVDGRVPFSWQIAVKAPALVLKFWANPIGSYSVLVVAVRYDMLPYRTSGGGLYPYNLTIWSGSTQIGQGEWNGQYFIVNLANNPLSVPAANQFPSGAEPAVSVEVKLNMLPFGASRGDVLSPYYVGSFGYDESGKTVQNNGLSQVIYFIP